MSMSNSAQPGLRLPWAGKKVNLDQVEEELSFLWKMAADNVRTSQNINVRTSVLNLVICAPDTETAQRASALMRDLSSTHIARVTILILDTSSSAASLSTWVTLRSFPIISDLMRHNFEQITMLASGTAVQAIANIIQPLLKPDLPVYIWWLGDPSDNNILFSNLAEHSNRVIIDSSSFLDPEQSLRALSSLFETSPTLALSDFNWGRITPWRELIAQFFDAAEYKPYLAGVNSIEIAHAALPFAQHTRTDEGDVSPNPICALLLASWLKTRLGWNLSADTTRDTHDAETGTYTWHMLRATGSLTRSTGPLTRQTTGSLGKATRNTPQGILHIHPQVYSDMRPGSLCLVRLVSLVEGKRATFTIDREDDPDHVFTLVELAQGTRPQRTVSMTATHKESDLLHDELEITGRDYLYEETLQEVFALLE